MLSVPGEEQPEEASIEAEEAADKEADLELQSDNPDPDVYPDKDRPTAERPSHLDEDHQLMATISAAEVKKLRDATARA